MRSARGAMRGADPAKWHYGPGFDHAKAARQHDALVALVAEAGAEIDWLEDGEDGLADSVFTHDPSLMSDAGAVILSMGKTLRRDEPALHEAAYRRLGIPILGRIEGAGRVEGGDCVWVDRGTLAVGRGVRTNQDGIQQLANIFGPAGVTVFGYDLPLWQGEEACLHLMSVISPARRRSRARSFAAATGAVVADAEGSRHRDGRGRRRGVRAKPWAVAQCPSDCAARGDRSRGFPEDEGRYGSGRLLGEDVRGRCAVHRLRGRADVPDTADLAPVR